MTTKAQEPGWPEIGVGLAAFMVVLGPCALMVGYFEGRPILQGVVGSTVGGLAGIGGFLAAVFVRQCPLRALGFRPVAGRWLAAAVGLALVGFGLSVIIHFTYAAWIGNDNPQGILHSAAQGGALAFVLSLLGGALFTPFGEEILFRGVIANALNRYGAWAGVGLSSVIFGLVHGLSVILPIAIMVGVLSAVLFRRTGSVWPSIVLHCVYNGAHLVASAAGFSPVP